MTARESTGSPPWCRAVVRGRRRRPVVGGCAPPVLAASGRRLCIVGGSTPAHIVDRVIVRRATDRDLRRLCTTAMRAFVDDPVMRWIVPDDDEYHRPGGEIFRSAVTNWLALDEVWCTDDAVALAAWIPPGRPEVEIELDPPSEPPPPDRVERFMVLSALLEQHMPPEPHWYLQLLGTHPDWQRQGLGAALMSPMFERAAAEGLPCYLETETAENVVYYRRHGFEVRSEWDVPDGPHMWGMLRPVR